jgi:hypothetical protein
VALDMIERMAVSPTTIISTTTAVEDDFTDKEWLEAVERRVQADKEAAGNGRVADR